MVNMFCNLGFPAYNFCAFGDSTPTITLEKGQVFPAIERKHSMVVHEMAVPHPKESSWTWTFISTFVILLLSVFYCLICYPDGVLGGRSFRGYVLGIISAVMMVFLTLYSARKRIQKFSYGGLETWLNLHIRIGLISVLAVLMHTGYQIRGIFALALFPSFILTIASGIFGSVCYILIPRAISTKAMDTFGREETTLRQMTLLKEAHVLVSHKSNPFNKIYEEGIKPLLYNKRNGFLLFLSSFRKRHPPLAIVEKLRKNSLSILEEERDALENLLSMLCEKFELEEKLFSMNVIDRCRDVHIVLTAIMLSLLGIHIVSVFYF